MTGVSGRFAAPSQRIVKVALAERGYDVVIGPGLLAAAGAEISARLGSRRAAVVTDRNVAGRHLAAVEASLGAAHAGSVVLDPGEGAKSFRELGALCERLLGFRLERGDIIVALGGGVIGDLTGFAAAVLRRGVAYVQMPTSLLAQVDSAVGGKTGINMPQGKNLVGAFHQPSLVLADTDCLKTLPPREMRAGYAEVVKYGLMGDLQFFTWLEDNASRLLAHDGPAVARAVGHSVEMKAAIVARDETDVGDRLLLNLGHTFGHALEAWTGYSDRLLHGEGVAIGMCLAFRLSEELELCAPQTAARVAAHLKTAGLPTRIADIPGSRPDAERLVALMAQDKKVQDGQPTLVLVNGIGQAFIARDVPSERIRAFLGAELGGGR